jgi:hypothetical protein
MKDEQVRFANKAVVAHVNSLTETIKYLCQVSL